MMPAERKSRDRKYAVGIAVACGLMLLVLAAALLLSGDGPVVPPRAPTAGRPSAVSPSSVADSGDGSAKTVGPESGERTGVAGSKPSVPVPNGDLNLLVIGAVQREPQAGVLVVVRLESGVPVTYWGVTGPQGDVHVADVPSGTYRLVQPSDLGGERRIRSSPGTTASTTIVVPEAAFVHGIVTGEGGRPLESAHVLVVRDYTAHVVAVTGADGRFSVRGVSDPARFRICCGGYAPSPLLALASGNHQLRLHRGGAGITGTVWTATGQAAPFAEITLEPVDDALHPRGAVVCARADAGGVFAFMGIDVGNYRLGARCPGLGTGTALATCPEGELRKSDIVVAVVPPLTGMVVDSAGAPVANAAIRLFRGSQVVAESATGDDGRFSLAGLPMDRLELFVALGERSTRRPVEMPGTASGDLRVVLP